MIIKKLDWISPPITLYFKGEGQHSSIFSGILSIIVYILVLISGVYYTLDFINRKSPKAYFYNKYIKDAGVFPVNSSSMFNFIQINDKSTNKAIPFDFTLFRAVGLDEVLYDEYMNNPDIILNTNHWIYGYCNNKTDTEGINYLMEFEYFEKSACIRKYYDKNKKIYFNTGEEGFRWPVVSKGCSNPDRTYYGIILQRCDESPNILKTQGPDCKNESEITKEISKVDLKFQIIDHYADVLNYKMPFTKYFYEVTSAITNGVYIINHLNFNPANMLTYNGIFFENKIEAWSYYFIQNEKHTIEPRILAEDQSTNGCLIGIYFWMQNTLQYYVRNYNRLQDVLSDIGGISSIVITIADVINLLVYNFIILLDTEDLIIKRDKANFQGRKTIKRPTILRRVNEFHNPPKYENKIRKITYLDEQKKESSSNCQGLIHEGVDIFKIDNNIKEENKDYYTKTIPNRSSILKNYIPNQKKKDANQNIKKSSRIAIKKKTMKYKRKNYKVHIDNKSNFSYIFSKEDESDESITSIENMPLVKQNFNWFKYIWYLLSCGRNNRKITFYENLRTSLISEENIIQSYLDVYQLLKLNNIQKKFTFS